MKSNSNKIKLFTSVVSYPRALNIQASTLISSPKPATTFCFFDWVLLLFETEYQFKQKAIIAEAEDARVPPAMEILVKTRHRQ